MASRQSPLATVGVIAVGVAIGAGLSWIIRRTIKRRRCHGAGGGRCGGRREAGGCCKKDSAQNACSNGACPMPGQQSEAKHNEDAPKPLAPPLGAPFAASQLVAELNSKQRFEGGLTVYAVQAANDGSLRFRHAYYFKPQGATVTAGEVIKEAGSFLDTALKNGYWGGAARTKSELWVLPSEQARELRRVAADEEQLGLGAAAASVPYAVVIFE